MRGKAGSLKTLKNKIETQNERQKQNKAAAGKFDFCHFIKRQLRKKFFCIMSFLIASQRDVCREHV